MKNRLTALLLLAASGAPAQNWDKSFCPAEHDDALIAVSPHPNEPNPLAAGEFSFDCQVRLDALPCDRTLFSKKASRDAPALHLTVTADNRLALTYCTEHTDPATFERTMPESRASTDQMVLMNDTWATVAVAHSAVRTSFWVDGKLLRSQLDTGGRPGPAVVDGSAWYFGGLALPAEGYFLPMRGRIDDVRLWATDMTEFYNRMPLDAGRDQRLREMLCVEFDMKSLRRSGPIEDQVVENRATGPRRFLFGELVNHEFRPPGTVKSQKPINIPPGSERTIAAYAIVSLVVAMAFVIWFFSLRRPRADYFLKETRAASGEVAEEAKTEPELPVEFGRLWPGERLEFVASSGRSVPGWRVAIVLGQLGFILFFTRKVWLDALMLMLSDRPEDVMSGLSKFLFGGGGVFVYLFFINRGSLDELRRAFQRKMTVVGTTERLLAARPGDGAVRTVFWEQVRSVEARSLTSAAKMELRTGRRVGEDHVPEAIWLSGLSAPRAFLEKAEKLRLSRPILNGGEDFFQFHPNMIDGKPVATFGPVEVHRSVIYSVKGFFGDEQVLLLRSRVRGAVAEPYDIPSPGWAVVLILENEARFPLFFTANLEEARRAAAFFS